MIDIPTWFISGISLVTTLVILGSKETTPIRIFALTSLMQFFIYFLFSAIDLSIEIRQALARSNIVFTDIALIIIILSTRIKKSNGK